MWLLHERETPSEWKRNNVYSMLKSILYILQPIEMHHNACLSNTEIVVYPYKVNAPQAIGS